MTENVGLIYERSKAETSGIDYRGFVYDDYAINLDKRSQTGCIFTLSKCD